MAAEAQRPQGKRSHRRGPSPGLLLALLIGLALKLALELSGAVSFNSDEAILGLMARHISQGQPVAFFYGQYYMGALHSYLVQPFFWLLGQTPAALRALQIVLYLGILLTTWLLARRLLTSDLQASAATLLAALPTVLFSTYTSAALGNYSETILIGQVLLLLGWRLLEARAARWEWFLAGLLAGAGWWAMALIVAYLLPLTLLGLRRFWPRLPWPRLALLAAGVLLGAAPWWLGLIGEFDAVSAALFGSAYEGLAGGFWLRVINLLVFNLPALAGMRPPWSVEWILLPLGLFALAAYAFAVAHALRRETDSVLRDRRASLLGLLLPIPLLALASSFGVDPTGRYFIPMYPALAILFVDWAWSLPERLPESQARISRWLPYLLLALLLTLNAWGNLRSVLRNPPGLTTQFDLSTHLPNAYDDALIALLEREGIDYGYANYWVSYRLAFLTSERLILAPLLPDKQNLAYTYAYVRYPPYARAALEAEHVAYVASGPDALTHAIAARLDALGVSYRMEQVGPHSVFYDLTRPVTPFELGPFGPVSGQPGAWAEGFLP